jgi:hypothetical protein
MLRSLLENTGLLSKPKQVDLILKSRHATESSSDGFGEGCSGGFEGGAVKELQMVEEEGGRKDNGADGKVHGPLTLTINLNLTLALTHPHNHMIV